MLSHSRRSFLSISAALTAGAALAGVSPSARAIEPIARNGKAKFKFSLAAYSYRDLLGGMTPKLTMADFVSDCAKFGLEGTELTSYYFPKNVTPDYLHRLATQCFRLGLDVSGTAIGNAFGHPPGERRLKEIAATKQWIDFAAVLGAPVIRIFAGHEQPGSTPAQAHSLMVSAIEECCEYAGKHGIYLALENHGGPTATAEGLLSFVRDVNSPWFGVNLDSGNFASADVYGDLAKIAPYAVNVQVKVVVTNDKKEKSPMDFKKLAALLREAHYRGYIVLEFEEKGDPREECPKYLGQIREAFA
jgi:sugar phosphate isomerase/epimerase